MAMFEPWNKPYHCAEYLTFKDMVELEKSSKDTCNPNTNPYKRRVPSTTIDVYDVLKAFGVTCPARQHAIKKMLCSGQRGIKSEVQDLKEAIASLERSIELIGDVI